LRQSIRCRRMDIKRKSFDIFWIFV